MIKFPILSLCTQDHDLWIWAGSTVVMTCDSLSPPPLSPPYFSWTKVPRSTCIEGGGQKCSSCLTDLDQTEATFGPSSDWHGIAEHTPPDSLSLVSESVFILCCVCYEQPLLRRALTKRCISAGYSRQELGYLERPDCTTRGIRGGVTQSGWKEGNQAILILSQSSGCMVFSRREGTLEFFIVKLSCWHQRRQGRRRGEKGTGLGQRLTRSAGYLTLISRFMSVCPLQWMKVNCTQSEVMPVDDAFLEQASKHGYAIIGNNPVCYSAHYILSACAHPVWYRIIMKIIEMHTVVTDCF